jgi:hypothetical protein
VGYEGDIMTAEVLNIRNERKFIPILREGDWRESAPSWLAGRYYIDLREASYSDQSYEDLITTLHGVRQTAPPVGPRPDLQTREANQSIGEPRRILDPTEPIRIVGIVVDEVTTPQNDGTYGSALYKIPFRLSRRPSSVWAEVFPHKWDRPPSWTTMHRPGIASVSGDKIYLDGTTIDEVEQYHRETLRLAVEETNRVVVEREQEQQRREELQRLQREEHDRTVRDAASRIDFD